MMGGNASHIAGGGVALFLLPAGPGCAAHARAAVCEAMRSLDLPDNLIQDAALAVSELATNSHLHATPAGPGTDAELWIWSRTLPRPQLVISVFDADRVGMPRPALTDILGEHGRGLAIVASLAAEWGAHPSLGRLGERPRRGKRVWFSLELPGPWPWTLRVVSASLASKRLVELLRARGIAATRICDDKGIALITAGHLNVWVEPKSFAWCNGASGHVRHPHLDVQEVAEQITAAIEQAANPPSHSAHARHPSPRLSATQDQPRA